LAGEPRGDNGVNVFGLSGAVGFPKVPWTKEMPVPTKQAKLQFEAELYQPEKPSDDGSWAFCLVPKEVSNKLPRRGRTTVEAVINGHSLQATLEPDGQLSHWLKVTKELQETVGVTAGDTLAVELSALNDEPDPKVPADLEDALADSPDARRTWDSASSIARLDWIHWVVSAKQARTRERRIRDACAMLAEGKKRVCCFDPSGFYSKALKAPKPLLE
jgi:hypothetical protein